MKMVKSLLLGSAAGLVAVAGAQAADLPVKAKPVEYVKICSAYGAGYYYIPGTDTCLKIGGFVRVDTYINQVGTFQPNFASNSGTGFNGPGSVAQAYPFRDSDDPDYLTRARFAIQMDARTQTEYGTLRSYFDGGLNWDSQSGAGAAAGAGLYFNRAFIQFAGFTFGYTQSFFDAGVNYMYTTSYAGSNTLTTALAYTAQFGNGFSATLALEDAANRTTGVEYGFAATTIGGPNPPPAGGFVYGQFTAASYFNAVGGQQAPDVVGNLRYEQAWGTLQLSAAAHQVVTADVTNFGSTAAAGAYTLASLNGTDTWGWAIQGAAEFKLPFLAAGDSFFIEASYSSGAVAYAGLSASSQTRAQGIGSISGISAGSFAGAFAPVADAIVTNPITGDVSLSETWAIQGQFRHYWTPTLRSAVLASYASYDTAASPELFLANFPAANVSRVAFAPTDFNIWQIGFNTIWSPVKNLDIGAEVVYTKLDLSNPNQFIYTGNGVAVPPTIAALPNQSTTADLWSGGVRMQRNF